MDKEFWAIIIAGLLVIGLFGYAYLKQADGQKSVQALAEKGKYLCDNE